MKKLFTKSQKLLIISLILLASCAIFTDKKTAGTFPIYGNYCGPNHPKAGTHPAPIDGTDSACMRHDECYAKNGYFNKECDMRLITELKAIEPQKEPEKLTQELIIAYFSEVSKF